MPRPSPPRPDVEPSQRLRSSRKTLITAPVAAPEEPDAPETASDVETVGPDEADVIRVRRLHRRDLKRIWEFLKRVFRDVNQKTVELQRPRSRRTFEESYDNEGIEQLVFEHGRQVVGYAECTFEATGADNWVNWRWFDARDMRPLFVEELAVDPDYQGRGVGSFMLEQLRHSASLRGCTHLVLEVAENNEDALHFYRKRGFHKIDAAIFLAQRIERLPELLPPKPLKPLAHPQTDANGSSRGNRTTKPPAPRVTRATSRGARPAKPARGTTSKP
jgi:ribosomal protein S18 acetylase RimI-like enzyme